MTEKEFYYELEKIGIVLSDNQKEQFKNYYKFLIHYNKKTNLTAIIDKDEVYLKHFYDSILVSKYYSFTNEKILDIGAGAGFPSVPLLICFPNLSLTVLDSNNKKTKFLQELKTVLGLNYNIVNDRAELYVNKTNEKYDIVVSRAVANLRILMELSIPFLKINGLFISYKSNTKDELLNIDNCLNKLSSTINKVETTLLKDDIKRSFIFIQKNKKTDNKYPRDYSKIKKNPL